MFSHGQVCVFFKKKVYLRQPIRLARGNGNFARLQNGDARAHARLVRRGFLVQVRLHHFVHAILSGEEHVDKLGFMRHE